MTSYNNRYKTVRGRLSLIFTLFFAALMLTDVQTVRAQAGKDVFKANCSACHSAADQKMTGPGLRGVSARRSEEWLLKWVKNSGELIKTGDADAVAIAKEFNNMPMPPFALSDEDIKSVFSYIDELEKTEKTKAAEKAKADSVAALTAKTGSVAGAPKSHFPYKKVCAIIILIGAVLFGFLTYVNNIMVKATGKGIPYIDMTEEGFFDHFYRNNRLFVNFLVILIVLAAVRGCFMILP